MKLEYSSHGYIILRPESRYDVEELRRLSKEMWQLGHQENIEWHTERCSHDHPKRKYFLAIKTERRKEVIE